jgi:hypothetical protein
VSTPLTRRQVIEEWQKNNQFLDYYCCTNCRDILIKFGDDSLRCKNPGCDLMNSTVGFLDENGKFTENQI